MAPNREENTTGELVEEIPPHHGITQVPKLKTKLGCAIYRNSGARTQPQQTGKGFQLPDGDFNFSGWPACSLVCYSSATRLQRLHHRINHTPPLIAQVNRRVKGGSSTPQLNILRLAVQANGRVNYFLEALLPLNTFNTTIFEDCYFNDGSAEDCYFIDNTEVCYFNDDQGVIKTPEAFKTLLLRIAGDQGPATPMLGLG